MKTKTKNMLKVMTVLTLTGVMLSPFAPQSKTAYAASREDATISDNYKAQPVVLANPAIGATVVKPTQNIEFKLSTPSHLGVFEEMFGNMQKMSKFGHIDFGVHGYLYDGKNVIQVPSSQIQFDAATKTIVMKHDTLNHYTQYAAVLQFGSEQNGEQDGEGSKGNLFTPSKDGNRYTDVVTKVDVVTGDVTLLGHGKINLLVSTKDEGHQDENPLKNFKVGDLVQVQVNPKNKTVHLNEKQGEALTTLFTTGSAIGEATHISGAVGKSQVTVVDGGHLDVLATDDYGGPATNATVSVTGSGSGNKRVASAFSAANQHITNGSASVVISDHSAEAVSISYTVTDNVYHDAVDVNHGTASETYLPGQTAKITVDHPAIIVAGKPYPFKGEALDVYGNSVNESTAMTESSLRGLTTNGTSTIDGAFSFGYTAATKSGAETISVVAGDSEFKVDSKFDIIHDIPTKAILTLPATLNSGKAATVTGTLVDQYGNPVNGSQVTFSGSLTGTVQTDAAGAFTCALNVGKSGSVSAVADGQPTTLVDANGQAITSIRVSSSSFGVPGKNVGVKTSFTKAYGMVADADGNMLAINNTGVYKFINGSWDFQYQLPDHFITDDGYSNSILVAMDKTGHLLIGMINATDRSENLVMRWNGSSWEQVAKFASNLGFTSAMYVNDQNVLYIGTNIGNLLKVENGSLVNTGTPWYDIGQITSIVVDRQGKIFVAGSFLYWAKNADGWKYVGSKMNWSLPGYLATDSKGQVYGADYSQVLKLNFDKSQEQFYYAAPSGWEEIFGFVIGKNDRLYAKYQGAYIKEIDSLNATANVITDDESRFTWTYHSDYDHSMVVDASGNIVHFRTEQGNPNWWDTTQTTYVYSPL